MPPSTEMKLPDGDVVDVDHPVVLGHELGSTWEHGLSNSAVGLLRSPGSLRQI